MGGSGASEAIVYRIRVSGHLDRHWADWFDGLVMETHVVDGRPATTLTGPVPDQAALLGLLGKIRDLGLPIDGVDRLPPVLEIRRDGMEPT
jgi:hypothetical protein